MHRNLVLMAAVTLAACGGKQEPIDDPGMQSSAKAVGTSSGTMANTPSDADESTISANVQAVGSNIQALVSQHQAIVGTEGVDTIDREALAADAGSTDTISWDGSHLVYDLTWDADGLSYVYDVDLAFAGGDAGTSIDGHYNLDFDYSLLQYSTHGAYDAVVIDEAGCAASGTLSVDWSADIAGISIPGLGSADASSTSGSIVVTFAGCDTVSIVGSGG